MPLLLLGLFLLALLAPPPLAAQSAGDSPETIQLWPKGAPGALGSGEADKPTLTIHLPREDRRVATAVVVCPGGGYRNLALDHEGEQVAEWFNSLGIAAFVLKYRLGPKYHHPAQLNDVQRAIRYVRANAERFQVSPDRIGVIGFSAGGHLASTAATKFGAGAADAEDPLDRLSSRPDFAILGYAVISFTTEYVHEGSRRNLLGDEPTPALIRELSTELQVSAQTPPVFLFHTNEDSGVPPENSVLFYLALRKAGVPAEMHIYERGRHGVGLAPDDFALRSWPDRLADWLILHGLLR